MAASVDQLVTAPTTVLQNLQNQGRNISQSVTLENYNENVEIFSNYLRLQNYFFFKGLTKTNDTQRAQLFLNCLGAKYYKLLSDLTLCNIKPYGYLKGLLILHLDKPSNKIVEQNHFSLRIQRESTNQYMVNLKNLSTHCNCYHIQSEGYNTRINKILNEFTDLFNSKIGKIPNKQATLKLKDSAHPIFC